MREFTKSMMSYTWAMSLFGVQQMVNVFRPSRAVESFDNVTEATQEEFGDALNAAFRAGDNLQKGIVDLTFGLFTFGMSNRGGGGGGRGGGRGSSRVASDVGQQSAEAFRQGMRAVGQTADAMGQAVQGTAYAAADAARQGNTGWGSQSQSQSQSQRGTGRGDGDTYNSGARYGTSSGVGQQTADAVGRGARAAGRAADAVGQAIEGAAYATASAVGGMGDRTTQQQGTGGRRNDDYGRRGDANARSNANTRSDANVRSNSNTRSDANARSNDRSSGASGGQAQGWGPMPSQSSPSSRR